MGIVINLRHERFAQGLAQGKAANEVYALAGYKANDGNASRLKGNERISARVQEIAAIYFRCGFRNVPKREI